MAVAYDAGSESHTGTTGSTSQASFSWTHTPSGTPAGILVFVFTNANADYITSVTWGGLTLTQVSEAADTSTEAGRCTAFFLGSGLSSRSDDTVTVNRTNNATVMYAVAMTVTADSDTETTGAVLLQNDGTLAEQSVDDGSPGTNSLRFAGINSGLGAVPSAGANSTVVAGIDFGSRVVQVVRETTAGQGARSVGFSSGSSDDRAAVHIAVREAAAPPEGPLVQWKGNSNNTGTPSSPRTVALDSSVTAGSLLVVLVSRYCNFAVRQAASVTDDNGNSYTQVESPGGWYGSGNTDFQVFYAEDANAGATEVSVSWTGTGSGYEQVIVAEFSGVATVSALLDSEVLDTEASASTSPVTGTVTAGAAGNLLVGGFQTSAWAVDPGVSGGWTKITDLDNGLAMSYMVAPDSGDESASWSLSSAYAYLGCTLAFAADSGGNQNAAVSGLASASSFGAVTAVPGAVTQAVSGLASASSLGSPTIAPGGVTVAVSGLASASAFGTGRINQTKPVNGLASASSFGSVTIVTGNANVAVSGIASASSFGSPTLVPGNRTVAVSGLASASAFGTPSATAGGGPQTAEPAGLASASAFGAIQANIAFGVGGLASASSLGAPTVIPGGVTRAVGGVSSASSFGTVTIATGNTVVSVAGLASASQIGTVEGDIAFTVAGLASAGAFGAIGIATGPTTVSIPGLASASAFGAPNVSGGVDIPFNPATQGGAYFR